MTRKSRWMEAMKDMGPRRYAAALAIVAMAASACVSVAPAPSGTGPSPVTVTPGASVATVSPTRAPVVTSQPTQAPTLAPTPAVPTTAPATATAALPSATAAPSGGIATPATSPSVPASAAASAGALDYSLPPNSGSVELTSGFSPVPHSVPITAGGPVAVSYLGDGCTGYASSAPDFSITYTSGETFSLLRFYFVATGGIDAIMVVNDPSIDYLCDDDSYETSNPTLDYEDPATGRYDVWIGTYTQGGAVSGTLYITETEDDHP